jgi:hypothetical protein
MSFYRLIKNILYILPIQILTYLTMKALKSAYFFMLCGMMCLTTQKGTSQEYIVPNAQITFEEQTPFQVKPVYFQEWYAGIEVGGTGYTVFVPVVNKSENIELDQLYFRNLEAKLVNEGGRYSAILKNPAKAYTFTTPEKPADYPFNLKENECVISYVQNGKTKYHKLRIAREYAGAYYKDGVPSIYTKSKRASLATLDEELDEN